MNESFEPSERVHASRLPGRAGQLSARAADRRIVAAAPRDYLDTTHFDTVRFPPPVWASELYSRASGDGSLAYSAYRGNDAVRADLAPVLSAWMGREVSAASELAITPGTQAGLFTALSAVVNPGDRVILFEPEYLFTERILASLGARIERVPLVLVDGSYVPDLDELQRKLQDEVALVVFSHPNNPTGAVYPRGILEQISHMVRRAGVLVLVDELYARLVYPDAGVEYVHLNSLPGMEDLCITLVGPSKTESLSGYRVGVVVAPSGVTDALEDVLSITALRAPGYGQHVLRGWLRLDAEWVADRIDQLSVLRDQTVKVLGELPWLRLHVQAGTAYAWPDVRRLNVPDEVVAERLAVEAGVLVSPGYQFGPASTGHFRVCFARDNDEWSSGLDRIVATLHNLARERGV